MNPSRDYEKDKNLVNFNWEISFKLHKKKKSIKWTLYINKGKNKKKKEENVNWWGGKKDE